MTTGLGKHNGGGGRDVSPGSAYLVIVDRLLAVEIERILASKTSVFGVEFAELDIAGSHVGHSAALGVKLPGNQGIKNG